MMRAHAKTAKKHFLNAFWFKNMVGNKKEWDLKQTLKGKYKFLGKWVSGAQLGNIHYGFVGKATGFPDLILWAGAGYAQIKAGSSKPYFFPWLGDDPRDTVMINWGIRLWWKDFFGLLKY